MQPLSAENVHVLIDRVGREAVPLQFLREIVENSAQASANLVRIGVDAAGHLWMADDGVGMTRAELNRYMGSIGVSGSSTLGDPHGNFGQGSRVSTLWWNPAGVLVHSRTPSGSATIRLARDGCGYGWEFVNGFRPPPGTVFGRSGTVFVFLGDGGPTGSGPGGQFGGPEFVKFLGDRYFTLPVAVEVLVGAGGRPRKHPIVVRGLAHALKGARAAGRVEVSNATVHWWVADVPGSMSVLYDGELFKRTTNATTFTRFGVFTRAARAATTLVIEPPKSGNGPGVFPTGARGGLMWTGNVDLDELLVAWGAEFRAQIPDEIAELNEESVDLNGWQGRVTSLVPRFRALAASARAANPRPGRGTGSRRSGNGTRERRPPKLPDVRWVNADDIGDGFGCRFVPGAVGTPGTVLINREFPVVQDAVRTYSRAYPHAPAALVESCVLTAFSQTVVATVCHVAALTGHRDWSAGRINQLLAPEPLTTAMFGILNVESAIKRMIASRAGAA